jgi:hypothetical protein
MRTTLRADPSPARRFRGAPGKAARHRGAHSVRSGCAAARASRPGVFDVPLTSDRPERSREAAESKGEVERPSTSASGLRSGRTAEAGTGFAFAFCFCLAPSRVRARMARCSTRGPCAAVRRGRQAAQRALPGMATPFRAGRSPLEKPDPDSRTCGADAPHRPRGGGLFFCLFSSGPPIKKVTRPPTALDRSSLRVLCVEREQQAGASLANTRKLMDTGDGSRRAVPALRYWSLRSPDVTNRPRAIVTRMARTIRHPGGSRNPVPRHMVEDAGFQRSLE